MKDKFWLILDDTGFNKRSYMPSEYLKGERATFCGIIIHEGNIPVTDFSLDGLKLQYKKRFGEEEFHFTEMGSKKELELKEFCDIVDTFIELLYEASVDVIVQSVGDCTYKDHPNLKKDLKEKYLSKMQMSQSDKTNCLVLSVLRAKKYIEDVLGGELAGVICDEGIRKPNTFVKMPICGQSNENIKIEFKRSKDYNLLQLADFVAWALSREKQILNKTSNQWTKKDEELLYLFSDLMQLYVNGTKVDVQLSADKNDKYFPYDEVVRLIREHKNMEK